MLARIKTNLKYGVKQGREWLQKWGTRRRRQIVSFLLIFLLSLTLTKVIWELVTEEIAIFGFHDIIDVTNTTQMPPQREKRHGDYTKQDLEELLEYLVKNNYWFLSTQDLYDYFIGSNTKPIPDSRKGQKRVMITVDDGYQNAHENILDLAIKLQEKYDRAIEIVWFVNPPFMGKLGKDIPSGLDRVSCEDFRAGLAAGFYDLQSHGANHTNLTELDSQKLEDDLSKSQQILRECTRDVDSDRIVANHIAYPFGAADDRVENAVKKYYFSGYNYSNQTLKGKLKNPYQIPRVSIHQNIPPQRLIRLAKGGWI
ncbi:polysaccharide deacetylase family protein [Oscillatoriales cyanobacterium LEGE 11467]|uniref:Polysaccharide deacetylase family protein n=1 Tax=Zarconia navalis LEGE 11467 TaxID=1828826 RepID=A0A928Z831_9CYAN|nr:polysaccharide deacetylase family protein [Zarconia navalis]MBE9042037.1 polysaccharide deacetylase family protein [Zarconia navalis LEGE 11467]